MSSEDVMLNALKSEIDGLKVYVDGRLLQTEGKLSELRAEVRTIDDKIELLNVRVQGINDRIDDIKFYVSLAFGVLAVIVTFATLIPSLMKFLNSLRMSAVDTEQIKRIVDEALASKLSSRQ